MLCPDPLLGHLVLSLFASINLLKCHCNEKIFDPILNTTEQHFDTSRNDVFSFWISCSVLEILRFFETCKLGVSDVIYSRIINYIYQMVNISVNSRQKSLHDYSNLVASHHYSYCVVARGTVLE